MPFRCVCVTQLQTGFPLRGEDPKPPLQMNWFKKSFCAVVALISASLASAATISARETSASTIKPKGSSQKDANFTDYTYKRDLRTEATLSHSELAAGAYIEVFYCRPDIRGAELATQNVIKAEQLTSVSTHNLVFEGRGTWKPYWAARVIIAGKVVAVAAENDKALTWIKARKVTVEGAQ